MDGDSYFVFSDIAENVPNRDMLIYDLNTFIQSCPLNIMRSGFRMSSKTESIINQSVREGR